MERRIKVFLRINNKGSEGIWNVKNGILLENIKEGEERAHDYFNKLYTEEDNSEIFKTGIVNSIDEFLKFKNCTIFAYGQTGSGKTYTMSNHFESDGLIQMILKYLIEKANFNLCTLEMSYIEIFNEKLYDLIGNKTIEIYSKEDEVIINNNEKIPVNDYLKSLEILQKSEENRRIEKTDFNERSSRSHTFLQIELKNKKGEVRYLNLIDLAGSEKASSEKTRWIESAHINRSLLALTNLMNGLLNNTYLNFRASKLTRLLQPSFYEECNLISICCISNKKCSHTESLSTVAFGNSLTKIKMNYKITRPSQNDEEENFTFGNHSNTELNNRLMKLKNEKILLLKRIENLEKMIFKLMRGHNPNRINDIFIIEKNLFNLKMDEENIKYENETEK